MKLEKASIDETQENTRSRLYSQRERERERERGREGGREKAVNHVISKCCQQTLKELQRQTQPGEEGDPRLKFDHIDKWYMHKPENVQDNETHKNLWKFEIQTESAIQARRPDVELDNKKKRTIYRLCCSGQSQEGLELHPPLHLGVVAIINCVLMLN